MAVQCSAFAEGGTLVALASLVHEEYGTDNFGTLYGTFLSFGAIGLFALDEIFFPNVVSWYGEEVPKNSQSFTSYGQWNKFVFSILAGSYFVCVILALISHISIKSREAAEGNKLVMVKF